MKKWLYFLLDDQGRSYKVTNGVVQKVAQPTPLRNSPDGWAEISLGWERNMNRFGVVRNFSLPLGFVKEGNHILRHIDLTGTVETKVYLLIKKLEFEITGGTYRWMYRYFYKGELDLSTIELGDEKSTVSIMEGGLSKLLAANEGNTYEFDLANDPEAVNVVTDGVLVKITGNYAAMEQTPNNLDYIFPLAYLSSDTTADPTIQHQSSFFQDDISTLEGNTNYFFKCDPARLQTFRVYGEFKINNTDAVNRNFGIQIRSQNATYYAPGAVSYAPGQHTIAFDQTITIPLLTTEVQAFFIVIVPGQATVAIERSELFVEYLYRYIPTVTKCYPLSVLFRKLIGKVAEGEQYAMSDLLTLYNKIVITSGDALRLFENAKLKTSLKDFFDSVNAWLNVGMGIENKKIRLEAKSHFFPSTGATFHLGRSKKMRISNASDLMCNKIKTGYKDQSYEDAFGRFEFNNTSEFTTPITRIIKELNLIAPYRTDPTGIEATRINYEGKTTTDTSNDNEVFALVIDTANPNMDGSFNLLRPAYSLIEGIPAETQSSIFNIDTFTPKRILKAHENWLRSIFYGFEDKRLIFQTTQKNRELRTIESGVLVDEDLNELIGNMAAPLFTPKYLEFECESPAGITDQFETEPNSLYSVEDADTGELLTGFLIKAGIAPDSNKEQTFKLLSSPSNDLTQLI